MKEVTVIVPIYNVEKYLRTCFESLKAQTSDAFVVLAVNDGSPDNSKEIIREYVEADRELFTGIDKPNGGYGSVLELAIRQIKTPYFLICDPDDTLEPTAVEELLTLAKISDADITVGAKTFFHEDDDERIYDPACNREFVSLRKNTVYRRETEAFDDLFFIDPSPHAKLYKKEVAKKIRFPKKVGYTDNLLFYISLLNSRKVIYTDHSLANYLVNRTGNTMTDVSYKAMNGQILVFKNILMQAEELEDVPDIFWYRMFESFKFLLYQTRRLKCTEEEYGEILDYLGTYLRSLTAHGRQIRRYYRKYTKNPVIEKTRDLAMTVPVSSAAAYADIRGKLLKEFRERQA